MTTFNDLEIKIFADGANLDQIPKINKNVNTSETIAYKIITSCR